MSVDEKTITTGEFRNSGMGARANNALGGDEMSWSLS